MKDKAVRTGLWAALVFALVVLPLAAHAGFTNCNGPAGNRVCEGLSVDNPPVPFRMWEFGGATESNRQRYYYWPGQAGPIRGKILVSHHATVEDGLGTEAIRQGNVNLNDTLGVFCITDAGCLNDNY